MITSYVLTGNAFGGSNLSQHTEQSAVKVAWFSYCLVHSQPILVQQLPKWQWVSQCDGGWQSSGSAGLLHPAHPWSYHNIYVNFGSYKCLENFESKSMLKLSVPISNWWFSNTYFRNTKSIPSKLLSWLSRSHNTDANIYSYLTPNITLIFDTESLTLSAKFFLVAHSHSQTDGS